MARRLYELAGQLGREWAGTCGKVARHQCAPCSCGPDHAVRYGLHVSGIDEAGSQRFKRANERSVVISPALTGELRDLASFERDFEIAAAYLRHYLASDIEGDANYASPLDAMWMTAILMYARAFAKGVRSASGPDLSALSLQESELHQYVLDVRNKYLAHSVNGFEQIDVVAFLTESARGERAITGIGHTHTSLSRMDREPAGRFLLLCERHLQGLERRISEARAKLTKELVALGGDVVFALPDEVAPRIDPSIPKARRS